MLLLFLLDLQFLMQNHHLLLFFWFAVDIVEEKGKESIISFAEGDEQRMMLMGLKRFTKYANYPDIVDLRIEIAEKVKTENRYCF